MSQDNVDFNGTRMRGKFMSNNRMETKKDFKDEEKNVLDETTAKELQEQMQESSKNITDYAKDRINNIMSEIHHKSETNIPNNKKQSVDKSNEIRVQRNSSRARVLSEKQFMQRNSLLTDLFENKHIYSIYNAFIVTLIILFLECVVDDYTRTGSIDAATSMIKYAFQKLDATFFIWFSMMLATFGVYSAFSLWARKRLDFSPKSFTRKLWDYGWLLCFIFFVIGFIVFPTKALLYVDLPIASSIIVLTEQGRMLMKCYAFVRSVTPRFLAYKLHAENEQPKVPEFSKYLYFFFAPTLIYRDSYPRTNKIQWKRVIWNYTEVFLTVFCIAIISKRFLEPLFTIFYVKPVSGIQFLKSICASVIPSTIYLFGGFYCLLHAWLNAWAEMLCFADRLFYMDWWNAKSYSAFYRSWNAVVYDWLYTYIYKDMYEIVTKQNRVISMCTVFLISSLYHEYVLSFAFRFFYPVMWFCFCVLSFCFMFLGKINDIFMWFSYFIGVGVIVSLYGIELNARLYCEPHENQLLDLFLPRSWYCYRKSPA